MSDLECMVGSAVVVLPDEIDLANAGPVGEQLVAAIVPGVAVVVADLSMTTFCDCAGVRSLLLAHREANASDAELRLVVRSRAVLRILELLGADQVLPVYPDLSAALAGGLICAGAEGAYLPKSAVAALSVSKTRSCDGASTGHLAYALRACPPRCPRTAINSQRPPPAANCEHETSAGFEPREQRT